MKNRANTILNKGTIKEIDDEKGEIKDDGTNKNSSCNDGLSNIVQVNKKNTNNANSEFKIISQNDAISDNDNMHNLKLISSYNDTDMARRESTPSTASSSSDSFIAAPPNRFANAMFNISFNHKDNVCDNENGNKNDNVNGIINGNLKHSTSAKRRRRSSAVPSSKTDLQMPTLKHEDSNGSLQSDIPKKKKKLLKPPAITLKERALTKKLSVKDLRDLILYVLQKKNVNCPTWLQVENKNQITKVITLFVPGLQPSDYLNSEEEGKEEYIGFPELLTTTKGRKSIRPRFIESGIFSNCSTVYVQAPGSKKSLFSSYNAFINVGLSKAEKQKIINELGLRKITINDLLMHISDLIEANYPIHPDTPGLSSESKLLVLQENSCKKDWINTVHFDHPAPHIFALDCEMCLTKHGHELTRVSIVDFNGREVYDQLVKPENEIIDYLTKYSGITREILENITYTLEQVQQDILKILSADDILIGHSLQSDLKVLKMRHPKIVDTSKIFDHKAGPPFRPSLKYLAFTYLNKVIQNDDLNGHDSFIDAKICMELTKAKIVNGLAYGLNVNTESIFRILCKSDGIRSITLNDYASKLHFLTQRESKDNCQSFKCTKDEEIIEHVKKYMNDADFFVGRMRNLEFARNYSPQRGDNIKVSSDAIDDLGNKNFDKNEMQKLKENITNLYNSVPNSTLIVLFSGSGDVRKYMELNQKMNKIKNKEEREKFQKEHSRELETYVQCAREAVCTLILKRA
ncbi:related to RNA exonuclease 1 [Saccharomycodes ludwigii]|uniref:Related to RNA exonuclease 1 n=1 Tax=Saccharomycodes ludwigii TaxID=36035 RepID=A0A376B814_9ASCO|nr:related to RNA exonuclease 1 [Saccharomycodes ludwigii]